jgi:alpha-ketoglutaric semialdehyde dehydrogenase
MTAALAEQLAAHDEDVMLHVGIKESFDRGLDGLARVDGVEVVHRAAATGVCGARPALLRVAAETFLAHPRLHEEVFGPSTLIVLCDDDEQMLAVARSLEGQLTATIHATESDLAAIEPLVTLLEQRAGRVLFGGYPTGVDVNQAMVHGGPYPATTHSGSTSVGTGAIDRFTRPVCWQSFPQQLLPEELRDDAPASLPRRVDGQLLRP